MLVFRQRAVRFLGVCTPRTIDEKSDFSTLGEAFLREGRPWLGQGIFLIWPTIDPSIDLPTLRNFSILSFFMCQTKKFKNFHILGQHS